MSKLGELLLKDEQITQNQLDFCVEFKKTNPKERLGAILKYHGFINDWGLAEALSKQIGWPVYRGEFLPDQEIIERVGVNFLSEHQMFPLKNGYTATFVISYIDNIEVTDLLRNDFGYENIKFYIGNEKDVRDALDHLIHSEKSQELVTKIEELKINGRDSISELMENLINLAIISRASDIHIEPTDKTTRIRFRIDGICSPVCCHKPEVMNTIANYLLTKCNSNTTDYKVQDGKFLHEYSDFKKKAEVRFGQTPSINGPVITLRILNLEDTKPLIELGYSKYNLSIIKQAISKPEGIILVTGPTGSGKSTTLSAILNQLKSIEKKILTAENPVERTIPLVSQLEINPSQGLTYAVAIRAFVRQDPDIISIGEIRDIETAHEALLAANIGIQIFSTLHCNNPLSAITRLKDLGVEAFNIASFLNAIISQRLVRKLCPHCKSPISVNKNILSPSEGKYLIDQIQVIYRANGCSKCRDGYFQRTVIAEVMLIDEEIKCLVNKDRLGEIEPLLKERGTYRAMAEDLKSLIFKGETSIAEAIRVLG